MATERIVDRMDSVFDLRIHKALNLKESVSARVLLTYSRKGNRKAFKIFDAKTTEEMKHKIASWLEAHIDVNDLAGRLGADEIDMDTFRRAANA